MIKKIWNWIKNIFKPQKMDDPQSLILYEENLFMKEPIVNTEDIKKVVLLVEK